MEMVTEQAGPELSPWWKIGVIFTLIIGFSVLIWIAVRSYKTPRPFRPGWSTRPATPFLPGMISWRGSRSF